MPPPPPQPPRRARLSAATTELLTAVLAFFAALLLAGAALAAPVAWLLKAVFGAPTLPAEQARQVLGVPLTPLAACLAAGIYAAFGRVLDGHRDPPPTTLPAPRPWLPTAGLVLLHLLATVAGSWILALTMQLLGAPVAEQTLVQEIVGDRSWRPEVAILALSALALAPLGEELFFRHQLFRRLADRAGPPLAYLGSAALFAVFHGNLQGFVVYFWLGLTFAHAYRTTGRISAAVAVHLGNNALTLAALLTTA